METLNTKNINNNFIAVPTNLFYVLDTNLRNCLIVLLQLSTIFADSDGYFSVSNQDLQNYFRLGKNLTSVCLETLYRHKIISTKIELTKTKKSIIKYRVNVEKFAEYNNLNFKSIVDNDSYQINTLEYGKGSNFKVTYTASTVENQDTTGNNPTSVQNNVSEEIPSNTSENVLERQETPNTDFVELAAPTEDENNDEIIPTESDKDLEYLDFVLSSNNGVDETEEIKNVAKEVEEIEKEEKQKELQQKLVVNVDGEKIETASAIPTNLSKVEKRSIYTNEITAKLDDSVKQKCAELVKRYVEMTIPSSNQSLELCNKGIMYIQDKFKQGFISLEDKDHFTRELIQARFKKHRI